MCTSIKGINSCFSFNYETEMYFTILQNMTLLLNNKKVHCFMYLFIFVNRTGTPRSWDRLRSVLMLTSLYKTVRNILASARFQEETISLALTTHLVSVCVPMIYQFITHLFLKCKHVQTEKLWHTTNLVLQILMHKNMLFQGFFVNALEFSKH